MAFIPVANCIQARLNFQEDGGVVAENVLYFATSGAPTSTDMEEVGDMLDDWTRDALMQGVTGNWKCTGAWLRAMNEPEGATEFYPFSPAHTGGATGAATPLQVSYSVTFSTGLIGRSARGRAYGLGIPNEWIVSHTRLTDGGRNGINGHWAALLAQSNTLGHALQVVSFVEGGVPRTAGRKLPVMSVNVRFPIATQRRRLS
jgi:hypothetical protein